MMYTFKLPSVRENVTIGATAAVSVPDEAAVVSVVDAPGIVLGSLLLLIDKGGLGELIFRLS